MKIEEEIDQKHFKSIYHKAYINMIFTNNWINFKARDLFKNHDITQQQYNILRILRGQFPKSSSVNFIKDRVIDKSCDASRIVDRLKAKGFIERTTNELDRRAVDVIITQNGLNLLKELENIVDELSNPFQNLTEKETEQLNKLLDKIRN